MMKWWWRERGNLLLYFVYLFRARKNASEKKESFPLTTCFIRILSKIIISCRRLIILSLIYWSMLLLPIPWKAFIKSILVLFCWFCHLYILIYLSVIFPYFVYTIQLVQVFWEGHNILVIFHLDLQLQSSFKTKWKATPNLGPSKKTWTLNMLKFILLWKVPKLFFNLLFQHWEKKRPMSWGAIILHTYLVYVICIKWLIYEYI